MQKKEDKVGNKTVYKEGRQRKNTESETEKDQNRSQKSCNYGLCASAKKNVYDNFSVYLHPFSRKYALCVANLIVNHSYDSQKSVQEGKWWKHLFFISRWPSLKCKLIHMGLIVKNVFKTWDAAISHLFFNSGTKSCSFSVCRFISVELWVN